MRYIVRQCAVPGYFKGKEASERNAASVDDGTRKRLLQLGFGEEGEEQVAIFDR